MLSSGRSGDRGDELRVDDFDYCLPPELIAQTPPVSRDDGRLLVVDRATRTLEHRLVRDLPVLLNSGDLLVVNNSRVIRARLFASKAASGGRVELLLLRPETSGQWSALARPVRRLRLGQRLRLLEREVTATARERSPLTAPIEVVVVDVRAGGEVVLQVPDGFEDHLPRVGTMPLPPYITAPLADEERYQTTYASRAGSAAAPTAGLHFTAELIAAARRRGIGWSEVTLHVGVDTFRPISVQLVRDHAIHREWCAVPAETAAAVHTAKRRGGRTVAVGTTAARTLETYGNASASDSARLFAGTTELFIVPGYRWTMVDVLFTNFHLPRSTLLMMVSAFADRDLIMSAYEEAIRERYRFYSFGDAMLII